MKNQDKSESDSDQERGKRPTHSSPAKRSAETRWIKDIGMPDQTEESLRAQEQQLQLMFDVMTEGVALNEIIYDDSREMIDYRILTVNRAFYSQADYRGKQVIGNVATNLYGMTSDSIKSFWKEHRQRTTTAFTEMWSPLNNKCFFVATSPFVENKFVTSFMDITERKLTEKALYESEEKWRSLVMTIPDFVAIHDGNGKYLFLNHFADGFTEKDVIGRSIYDFILPEARPLFKLRMEELQKTGKMQHFEFLGLGARGEPRNYEETLVSLKSSKGETNTLAFARDITEHKQVEDKLYESEERYRDLVENSHELIYTHDLDGKLLSVNHTAALMLGYNPNTLVGRNLGEILLPEEREHLKNYLGKIRRKSSAAGTLVLKRVTGERLIWEYQSTLRSDSKQGLYVRGMAHDITERMRAEADLRESQELFSLFMKHSPIYTFINESTPGESRVLQASDNFQEMTGISGRELVGKRMDELFTPEAAAKFTADNWAVVSRGEVLNLDEELNGRQYATIKFPIVRGDKTLLAGYAIDMTERKRTEKAILRRSAELAALNQIGQTLNKLAKPDEMLELIFTVIGQVLDNRNLFIALFDQTKQTITFPVYAINGERIFGGDRPLGNGITDYIVRTNTSLLVKQNLADALAQRGIELIGTPSRSFLAVPMRLGNKVIGVIALRDYERDNAYDEQHLELLTTIAAQASTALENARLFDELQQELEERKQAEERLRQSEADLNKAQQASHVGSWKWHIQTNRLEWSDEMYHIFGISMETFTGNLSEVIATAIHPEDRAMVEESNRSVSEAGVPVPLEYRLVWPDGSIHTVWAEAGELFKDEKEQPALLTGIVQDITERKQAEELLRQGEARFKLMFEHAPLAINITRDTDIIYANPAYIDMFGYTSLDELQHVPPLELFTPEFRPVILENIRRRSQGIPVPSAYEAECLRKDGTRLPVIMNLSRTIFSDGPATVGFILDITERKQAEVQLAQSHEQLRALSQYLQAAREEERTFIAREIHDELGQELTALKMDLAWLVRQLPPEQNTLIQKTAAMSAMVDGTIQTVRRVASQLRPGMLDDLGLVAALEWQAGEFQSRTGIACKLDLPEQILTLGQDRATAMFRVFQETLTNIARHAQATSVRIALKEQPAGIELLVRDNGIGITQDQLTDPRSLGLTGMHERVSAFGGTLEFKSAPGKGTSVHVSMPAMNKQLEKEV